MNKKESAAEFFARYERYAKKMRKQGKRPVSVMKFVLGHLEES